MIVWFRIPVEMSPEIQLPSLTVNYSWSRTSPEVVEKEITRRVEQQVRRLRDVQRVTSVTREGLSSVTIYFHKEAPVDYRAVELQEYLRLLEGGLPPSIQTGRISRRVPSELREMQTFLIYSISGDREPHELLELTERSIKLPLSGISGVAGIELTGVRDPALTIDFDVSVTERLGISIPMAMQQINSRLNRKSAGFRDESGLRYSLMVPPGFHDLDDIRAMPVKLPNSERQVQIGDLAQVAISDYPERSTTRINGNPALTIHFERETGTDAMQLAEVVIARMEEIKAGLPQGINLQIERDATLELREELATLERQAMISLTCVFVILLVFIRKIRAPLVILGSILFSMLFAVIMLHLIGYTINVITLAGLTIALGMIIDNAVVVFEHVNPGLPLARKARIDHIHRHLPHVLVPVLGSTLTTIGIFIPLLFALEEVRILLMPLGLALTITLLASVVISLTWIPYALIWLVRVPSPREETISSSKWAHIHPKYIFKKRSSLNSPSGDRKLHDSTCRLTLNRIFLGIFFWRRRVRWLIYPAFVLLIGIPLFLIPEPELKDDEEPGRLHNVSMHYFENRDFIDPYIGGLSYRFGKNVRFGESWGGRPEYDYITVIVRPPVGSPFEEIDKIIRRFESLAEPFNHAINYYESQVSELGAYGRLQIYFKEEFLMQPDPYRLYGQAVYLAARTGNTQISVSGFGDSFSSGYGGGMMNFSITLQGYSYEQLEESAMEIRDRLTKNQRVNNVDINFTPRFSRDDLYQFVLNPDSDHLISRGLDRPSVMHALQLDINPEFSVHGRVTFNERQMYLIARNMNDRQYMEQFEHAPRRLGGKLFTVGEIGSLDRIRTMAEIRREDQMYTRVVGFDFLGPYRLGESVVKNVVDGFPVPAGMSITSGRDRWFSSDESDQNLMMVFLMAILSVWMIISALLERWRDPAIILLSIPLGVIGIMAGVIYHDLQFDRSAIAGTLLVIGVVVNNAILLMHGKQKFRLAGIHGLRSWVYVYREKMRPVLITTITTLGGLLPLIILEGSGFWQSLATVVFWGLASSTIFLLLLMGIWEGKGKLFKISTSEKH